MPCPNSCPVHGNHVLGQENLVNMDPPPVQGLGNYMDSQQQVYWSPFWAYLEQDRLLLDQALQALNGKVQVMLQQQMALHNQARLDLMESITSDMLIQKNDEINHLYMELQNTQEVLKNVSQVRDAWKHAALEIFERNEWLISQLSASMWEITPHGSSYELGSSRSYNQTSNMEGISIERGHPNLVCKLCHSRNACILLLPCRHLCACKSCGVHLSTCPICNLAKTGVVEARFV
ncbi:hypothetical protein ACP4OV_019054 [Aristida adscensionis]